MKVFVLAAALLIQGPPPLPQQLNVSQIATPAGAGVATPAAAQAAPGGGQLPATQLDVDPQPQTQPIEVEVSNGDLRPLLTLLAQAHGFNLLMGPEVSATVTINLRDVTLEEALQIILTPLDLEYSIEGDLLRVGNPEVESRTFEFNYVSTIRNVNRSLSASASAGGGARAGMPSSAVAAVHRPPCQDRRIRTSWATWRPRSSNFCPAKDPSCSTAWPI